MKPLSVEDGTAMKREAENNSQYREQYGPQKQDFGQCKICGDIMHQTYQHSQYQGAAYFGGTR